MLDCIKVETIRVRICHPEFVDVDEGSKNFGWIPLAIDVALDNHDYALKIALVKL